MNILSFHGTSSVEMTQIKLRIFASGFSNYCSSNLYFKYTIPRNNRILHCNKVYVQRHDILCKISHTYPGISPRGVEYTSCCLYIDSFNRINARALLLLLKARPYDDRRFHIRKYCVMLKIASLTFHSFTEGKLYVRDFLRNSAPLTGNSTLSPYRHYFRLMSVASG